MSLAISERKALAQSVLFVLRHQGRPYCYRMEKRAVKRTFLGKEITLLPYQHSTNLITREKRLHRFIKYHERGTMLIDNPTVPQLISKLLCFVGSNDIV